MRPRWTHWATTRDLASLRVSVLDRSSQLEGDPLGVVQYGPGFAFDPFDAYGENVISNPNMVVAGSIGFGKSTLVKMIIDRSLARDRRVVVLDPKGEYADLAHQHGVRVLAIGRDGWCNPFLGSERENKEFLRSLLASAQGAELSSDLHYALDTFWAQLPDKKSHRLLRELFNLTRLDVVNSPTSTNAQLGRLLHRFVEGDLMGIFDGEGEPMNFNGNFVVIDLSTQWMSNTLSLALLSAVASAQQVLASDESPGYLILDEAWTMLADDHALRWLQGSWKLARSRGISHILVLHRWSDVGAVGDEGSAKHSRAMGLLRECETTWLFRQPEDEAGLIGKVIGLNALEERYLKNLPKGVALVRYGRYRSIVKVEPNNRDRLFIDTDEAMRAK